MTPNEQKRRPAEDAASEKMITKTTDHTTKFTATTEHGAMVAANSANALWRFLWERAVLAETTNGNTVSADTVQAKYDLPDIGPACGGVFMSLHRRGLIRRVGYRPSDRSSRAGGVIAIWASAKEAA